jgi:hypothetical protein
MTSARAFYSCAIVSTPGFSQQYRHYCAIVTKLCTGLDHNYLIEFQILAFMLPFLTLMQREEVEMKGPPISLSLLIWALAAEGPLFASPSTPGVFYVAAYGASGTHTDYDMARQAADAYVVANPWYGSILVLKPATNETCDAVPLPSLGSSPTTSIIGYGSGSSSILKSADCAPSAATLRHNDSPNGALSRGLYQGFTVDANHIDSAACEMYGMQLTTVMDVKCGNAVAGADHELEFGNLDANDVGWMDNIYIYDLMTFDSVPEGEGAILTPVWGGGTLRAATVSNGGTSPYSRYVRARLVGPDISTCSIVPTLTPTLNAKSFVNGATITNTGSCQSTTHIYVLLQDGTPVTYGMKFTNMADSHVWGLRATGSTTYGEAWLGGSPDNSIYGEQPGSNQMIEITDNANGNRHINPTFINPGEYAAAIYSQNGTFQGPLLVWDNDSSYVAASGYYIGNDPRVFQDWVIQNSRCFNSTTSNFIPLTTRAGTLSADNTVPPGVKPQNIESCDGSNTTYWDVTGP